MSREKKKEAKVLHDLWCALEVCGFDVDPQHSSDGGLIDLTVTNPNNSEKSVNYEAKHSKDTSEGTFEQAARYTVATGYPTYICRGWPGETEYCIGQAICVLGHPKIGTISISNGALPNTVDCTSAISTVVVIDDTGVRHPKGRIYKFVMDTLKDIPCRHHRELGNALVRRQKENPSSCPSDFSKMVKSNGGPNAKLETYGCHESCGRYVKDWLEYGPDHYLRESKAKLKLWSLFGSDPTTEQKSQIVALTMTENRLSLKELGLKGQEE